MMADAHKKLITQTFKIPIDQCFPHNQSHLVIGTKIGGFFEMRKTSKKWSQKLEYNDVRKKNHIESTTIPPFLDYHDYYTKKYSNP